jgi:uncharacterized protein with PQ loop repeat
MNLADFFGYMGMLSSFLILFGLMHQIRMNFKKKNTEGISSLLITITFFSYLSWSGYAWVKPDEFLKIPQTGGFVLSIILIGQMVAYRKNNAGQKN